MSYRALWAKILTEIIRFHREKHILIIGLLKVFDISNIPQALGYFSLMVEIVITLKGQRSVLRIQPPRYKSVFSPRKSYITVGCLGDLG